MNEFIFFVFILFIGVFVKKEKGFIVITTYFNYSGNKIILDNFKLFRKKIVSQGATLCVVELSLKNSEFELQKKDADYLIQVRSGSVMWQKERLLNIALKQLPQKYSKIAVIDADILFLDDSWLEKTIKALDKYNAVQLFRWAVNMPRGKKSLSALELSSIDFALDDNSKYFGVAYNIISNKNLNLPKASFAEIGRTGMAWAFKRSIIENTGFFDKSISGSGDLFLALGMYTERTDLFQFRNICKGILFEYKKWVHNYKKNIGGKVFYLDNTIVHLWHGQRVNRNYFSRQVILSLFVFLPSRDLIINSYGCFEFRHRFFLNLWMKNYFFIRNQNNFLGFFLSFFLHYFAYFLLVSKLYLKRLIKNK